MAVNVRCPSPPLFAALFLLFAPFPPFIPVELFLGVVSALVLRFLAATLSFEVPGCPAELDRIFFGGVFPTSGEIPGFVGVEFRALCCPGVIALLGLLLTGRGCGLDTEPGLLGEADTVRAPG